MDDHYKVHIKIEFDLNSCNLFLFFAKLMKITNLFYLLNIRYIFILYYINIIIKLNNL